jgi:hypothetical protein
VGLCSITGSTLAPPLDAFNGHLLYINDDGFNISQRAWDFMSTYSLFVPGILPGVLVPIMDLILGN